MSSTGSAESSKRVEGVSIERSRTGLLCSRNARPQKALAWAMARLDAAEQWVKRMRAVEDQCGSSRESECELAWRGCRRAARGRIRSDAASHCCGGRNSGSGSPNPTSDVGRVRSASRALASVGCLPHASARLYTGPLAASPLSCQLAGAPFDFPYGKGYPSRGKSQEALHG